MQELYLDKQHHSLTMDQAACSVQPQPSGKQRQMQEEALDDLRQAIANLNGSLAPGELLEELCRSLLMQTLDAQAFSNEGGVQVCEQHHGDCGVPARHAFLGPAAIHLLTPCHALSMEFKHCKALHGLQSMGCEALHAVQGASRPIIMS